MNISLEDTLKRIEKADDLELNEIMEAVRKRYSVRFPNWEVLFISCPKNDSIQRQQTIDFILKHIQNI